ncbi:MAG: glycosyltransferase family 39 protein [Cyanobacteria bacterium J06635_1]
MKLSAVSSYLFHPPKREPRKFMALAQWQIMLFALSMGVFFRFYGLDHKLYWLDEVDFSMRIAGYSLAEIKEFLTGQSLVSAGFLERYQYPQPDRTLGDMLNSIFLETTDQVPIFYALARYWTQLMGNSIAVVRSASAMISLFSFVGIYWLAQELFQSKAVSRVALLLLVVSPVHIIYAQEARPYSLLIVSILFSTAVLLRALKSQSKLWWAAYSFSLIFGVYTHLIFGLVGISQGLYVLILNRFRIRGVVLSYLASAVVALFAFLPWLAMLISQPSGQTINYLLSRQGSMIYRIVRVSGILSRVVLDFGTGQVLSWQAIVLSVVPVGVVLLLFAYALYVLVKKTARAVWLLPVLLIVVPAILLVLPNILIGTQTGTTRYMLPMMLGIQLTLAYLLATKLTTAGRTARYGWQLLLVVILSCGIFSGALRTQTELWWDQLPHLLGDIPASSTYINQAQSPLVVVDADRNVDIVITQVLAHRLSPETQLSFLLPPYPVTRQAQFSDVFLFQPSDALRSQAQQAYGVEAEQLTDMLWELPSS